MTEWLGGLINYLPSWLVLPVAFLVTIIIWVVWMYLTAGDVTIDRWWNRRKREKELKYGKK